jgi:putative transposase
MQRGYETGACNPVRASSAHRAECLNANWFMNLDEACRKCEDWRRDDNTVRPYIAIGNKVPAILHLTTGNPDQPVVR